MTTREKLAMKKFQIIDFPKEKKQLERNAIEMQKIDNDVHSQFNCICNKLRAFGIADTEGKIMIDIPYDIRIVCRADNNPGIFFVKHIMIDKNNYVKLFLVERDNENDKDWFHMIATNMDWLHTMYILLEYIEDFKVKEH